jgi:hypothetical protein
MIRRPVDGRLPTGQVVVRQLQEMFPELNVAIGTFPLAAFHMIAFQPVTTLPFWVTILSPKSLVASPADDALTEKLIALHGEAVRQEDNAQGYATALPTVPVFVNVTAYVLTTSPGHPIPHAGTLKTTYAKNANALTIMTTTVTRAHVRPASSRFKGLPICAMCPKILEACARGTEEDEAAFRSARTATVAANVPSAKRRIEKRSVNTGGTGTR